MVETLKPADEYTFAEQLTIAEDCGIFLDEDQTLDDVFLAWRHNIIGGRSVMIYIYDGELFLRVNGSTARHTPQNPPVDKSVGRAIWIWFVAAWADMLDELGGFELLECCLYPEHSDGHFDKRVEVFKLMGFEFVSADMMLYKPYRRH
jgi:hypothetical protein